MIRLYLVNIDGNNDTLKIDANKNRNSKLVIPHGHHDPRYLASKLTGLDPYRLLKVTWNPVDRWFQFEMNVDKGTEWAVGMWFPRDTGGSTANSAIGLSKPVHSFGSKIMVHGRSLF